MTVKCLNEVQKSIIADLYREHQFSKSYLAKNYGVSRRTIARVIEEREFDASLGIEGITVPQQQQIPRQSLLQRIKAAFKRLFS